jgi:hypothetical protein
MPAPRDARQPARLDIAEFRDPEGEWLDIGSWPTYQATATCTTPSCPAFGIPYGLALNAQVDGVWRASCGPCGQPTRLDIGDRIH